MRKEKIIAILLLIFNCLTNLLMLFPAAFFGMFIADGLGKDENLLPFVLVGIPAIVFSYTYSIYFIRSWFYKTYEQERALLNWLLSVFHYVAFLAYMAWLFLGIDEFLRPEDLTILLPLLLPILLSLLGIYLNRDENFAEQKNNEKIIENSKSKIKSTPNPKPEKIENTASQPISKIQNPFPMNQPNQPNTFGRFSQWLKESIIVKLLSIGFLVLILLIPNSMISDLINERQMRQDAVTAEVSKSWGGFQSVTGPVLSIPFSTWTKYDNGTKSENKHTAYFLPKKLNVEGDLSSQIRERSIFEVILYQAELTLGGEFEAPDFSSMGVAAEDIHWGQARLSVGIGGMTGIKEMVRLDWNGTAHEMEPGTASPKLLRTGVSAFVGVSAEDEKITFSIPIKLNGSGGIRFEPVGKSTQVNLRSDWPSPSFTGDFLPDEREVSKDGFTAKWQVLDLNRSYPQQWKDEEISFAQNADPGYVDYRYSHIEAVPNDGATLAVRLVQPVNEYLKNTRSAKYAILVIGLTFLLYLFFEVLQKLLIHPFQYLLVGLAITVFYLLLLSLSEHFGFNLAYMVSAVATIGLITGYSWSFLGIKRLVFQLAGLLVAIYGFIFVLLQLEDFALLAGAVGVFIALAAVMYSSRKVDWYNLGKRE